MRLLLLLVGLTQTLGFSSFNPIPVSEAEIATTYGKLGFRIFNYTQAITPIVIFKSDNYVPSMEMCAPFKNAPDSVWTRIHDQCVTSEIFKSRHCDCAEQLDTALEHVSNNNGMVIYLQQEGRGIGIGPKIHSYSLQNQGVDTVDANHMLGFKDDERIYDMIPGILKSMGVHSIQLATNNPYKIDSINPFVNITRVNPIKSTIHSNNAKYMTSKVNRMSHNKYLLYGDQLTSLKDTRLFSRQSVINAINAIKRGKMVIVVDDANRENEGDFIMAAEFASAENMARMIHYTSGVICVAMEGERMDELEIPPMVTNNQDPKETAFGVSVDGINHNITTGISALDRTTTVRMLADPRTVPQDLSRPGHLFPLRAKKGGVLERNGHTEATIDLMKLAGLQPCGVLSEIVSQTNRGEMARVDELKEFAKTHDYVMTSILDIQQYIRYKKSLVTQTFNIDL
jgi:3,4-dihydroxy 2-butanone 4-phosphate synthase/GTP cyclohydrolase II